jgi:hypothetical protein
MRISKGFFALISSAAILAVCACSSPSDPSLPDKGVAIVVDSAVYHLEPRSTLGFRVNVTVTVVNDTDHDVYLAQECGYYSVRRVDGSRLELGAYACAVVGGGQRPTPLLIASGARYTKAFNLLGSIQPQARPQITLEDNIGSVKFTYVFTNQSGKAFVTLDSAPFTVLPPA